MLFWSMTCFLVLLLGMGGVAFVTLLERKLLGLSQARLGPNKVSMWGLLQPVADGIKLLLKEGFFIKSSQSFFFYFSPILLMIMFMAMWIIVTPWWGVIINIKYSVLLFFIFLGIGAYTVILVGWSSLSAFSKLGSLRGMLQSLSFEVALILVFIIIMMQTKSASMNSQQYAFMQELNFVWMIIWFILSLMETNRAPFDLLEGESELISGFNIELGSLSFVLLFLSEYGMIIVMMMVMSLPLTSLSLTILMFVSLLLFMRSCYPRVRYDIMMSFMWLSLLPLAIILLMSNSFVV